MLANWVWLVCFFVTFVVMCFISMILRYFLIGKSSKHPHNDFLDPSQQIIGLIYGVLLAFVVVLSWQSYTSLSVSIESEAISLLNIWRNAETFPTKERNDLTEAILGYLEAIQTVEWPLMKKGIYPDITSAYSHFWAVMNSLEPQTKAQNAHFQTMLEQLNDCNSFRRARILGVSSNTPFILWSFLLGGACYLVILTFLYNVPFKLRIFLAFLQLTTVTSALYLVSNFNHPFEGSLVPNHKSFLKNV